MCEALSEREGGREGNKKGTFLEILGVLFGFQPATADFFSLSLLLSVGVTVYLTKTNTATVSHLNDLLGNCD